MKNQLQKMQQSNARWKYKWRTIERKWKLTRRLINIHKNGYSIMIISTTNMKLANKLHNYVKKREKKMQKNKTIKKATWMQKERITLKSNGKGCTQGKINNKKIRYAEKCCIQCRHPLTLKTRHCNFRLQSLFICSHQ